MPAPRCRRFTVLDGMALVAATAVGLWIGLSMRSGPIGPSCVGLIAGRNLSAKFFRRPVSMENVSGASRLLLSTGRGIAATHISLDDRPLQPSAATTSAVTTTTGASARFRRIRHGAILALVMFLGGLSSSLERATWGDGVRPTLGMELISFRNQCLTEDRSEIFGAGIASVWALLALGQIARASADGWTGLDVL